VVDQQPVIYLALVDRHSYADGGKRGVSLGNTGNESSEQGGNLTYPTDNDPSDDGSNVELPF
jgi:hypothetical protein